jgi:4-amino-4-deoxy-L-arabinose transferase-like glycosyltransferase
VLLAIAAVAAALFAWNIANAGLAPFYSVAVKSMSESWKAFFYGAFDPKATITIDKLAGSFAPQALSARIFGYHAWSLALPQVIEGVISVLAMYRMVRRWAGAIPGLVAALIFALTPIAASMFGHSMEDGALTMCLVLAADAWTASVIEGRLAPLLWAGFWVGAGFQCKMLQAWMVLPAFFLAYLFCARGSWGRRIRDLALFGVVTLGVSLSWILLYTFTPAADRPYVDGSTNNSAWSMVFGYNGLERFGISVPGSVTSGPGVSGGLGGGAAKAGAGAGVGSKASGAASGEIPEALRKAMESRHGGGFGAMGGGGFGSGWTKLLGSEFGPQIGWLFPLTVLALVCGLLWTRKTGRSNLVRAGFLFWGIWFVTFFLIFSKMSQIPHTAYVASLAPAIAALSAAGIVMFWRLYRARDRRGWMLPIAVAASLAWAIFLWRSYSGFLPWALWAAVAVGVIAIAILIVARVSAPARTRLVTAGLTLGVVAMLAPAGTWAASVLDANYAGSSFNAGAGPDSGMGGGAGFGGGGASGKSALTADRAAFGSTESGSAASKAGASGSGFGAGGFGTGGFGGSRGLTGRASAGSSGSTTASGSAPGGAPDGSGGFPAGGPGGGAGGGAGGMMGATTSLTSSERQIYDYVSANRGSASYLMAVGSWSEASPYILSTGQEVMAMGGFSGSVPEPTLTKVQDLVHSGQLKFFLLSTSGSSRGFGAMGGSGSSTVTAIDSWVKKTCTAVPAKDYGGATTSSSSASSKSASSAATGGMGGFGASGGSDTLYECKS